MKKKVFLLFMCLILQGCLQYTKSGTILANNEQYYKEWYSGGISSYQTVIPFDTSKYGKIQTEKMPYKNAISIRLPNRIKDTDCRFFSWILFPVYFKRCEANTISQDEYVYTYIYKPYYTNEFIKNINISLVYKNKTYKGNKINGYAGSNDYIQFTFPIKIRDVEKNGAILILNYEDFNFKLPIEYKLMWYQG